LQKEKGHSVNNPKKMKWKRKLGTNKKKSITRKERKTKEGIVHRKN